MAKIEKKALLHKMLASLYSILEDRKVIIFDTFTEFHFKHLSIVIKELARRNDFDIFVIGVNYSESFPATVKFISDYNKFPLYRKVAAFITTEYGRTIYWLDCPNIFFGHGMGLKLGYAAQDELKGFDYVFSSCKPVFDVQNKIMPSGRVKKIGLPILEDNQIDPQVAKDHLGFNNTDKQIVLYAPSWSTNTDVISDIDKILRYLENLAVENGINIAVSPHPNLLIPEKCSGKSFFEFAYSSEYIYVNEPGSAFSTLDLVRISDCVVSDISSILFEAMALDKLVIFDGNKSIYEFSDALPWYDLVRKISVIPNWGNKSDTAILDALKDDIHKQSRNDFIEEFVFNIGKANEACIQHIYQIACSN